MQPRRLRCVLRRGAQSGYGVCNVSDTWWARMIDLLGGRLLSERFVFREHGRRSGLSCGGQPGARRGVGRRRSCPRCNRGVHGESTTTDGEAQKPRLPLVHGRFPCNRAEERALRCRTCRERGYRGLREGVFFDALRISERYPEADVALHALSRARCWEKRPDVCMETSGCAARVEITTPSSRLLRSTDAGRFRRIRS